MNFARYNPTTFQVLSSGTMSSALFAAEQAAGGSIVETSEVIVNLALAVVNPTTGVVTYNTPPPPTVAELLAYASDKQNSILAQIWTFNVGTSEAPINLTTRLDAAGQAAMVQLLVWANLNASNSSAAEPYSNVDFTSATLTVAQATNLGLQAGAVKSSTYATLNMLASAIMTSPPTITTNAQIDAYTWPTVAAANAGS